MESSFRTYLQNELTARCSRNPNYSLRSYAKALGISASALSQILSGKRPITDKSKLRLGSALGLSSSRIHAMSTKELSDSNSRFQQITLDQFALISDWYHYAILELTHTKGFKSEAAWIARRLGITKSEANIAIDRLTRLELLDVTRVPWKDLSENGELTHLAKEMTSIAAKKYQGQLLDLSKKAVQEVPLHRRNHTSATFCFDVADMESAIQRIGEFRRSFAKEFQPSKKGGDVYQIQISFFPLTNPDQEKK